MYCVVLSKSTVFDGVVVVTERGSWLHGRTVKSKLLTVEFASGAFLEGYTYPRASGTRNTWVTDNQGVVSFEVIGCVFDVRIATTSDTCSDFESMRMV